MSSDLGEARVIADERLERAIACAVVLEGDLVDHVAPILRPEHMLVRRHGFVYAAALAQREAGEPVDALLVKRRMQALGTWLALGRDDREATAEFGALLADGAVHLDPERVVAQAREVRALAELRALVAGCEKTIARARTSGEGTPSEIIDHHQRAALALTARLNERPIASAREVFGGTYDELRRRADARGGGAPALLGERSGLPSLDKAISGYRKGVTTIIAGRPSMGKTSLALQALLEVAQDDDAAVLFSLEMPRDQVAEQMVCSAANLARQDAVDGDLSATRWGKVGEVVSWMRDGSVLIDDAADVSTAEIRRKLTRVAHEEHKRVNRKTGARRRLRLFVVDYLQLLKGRPERGKTRDEVIAEIMRELRAIAKDFGIPCIALSQLSREVTKRQGGRPMLSDLRESGSLEADAHTVLFVHRENLADPRAEIIVGKCRGSRAHYSIKVAFDGWRTTFRELRPDEADERERDQSADT